MKEFGSDFHYIKPGDLKGNTLGSFFPSANYYADGRQAIIHLFQTQGWGRLWVPEYFCYDVVESLRSAGIDLCFYADYPGNNEDGKSLEAMEQRGLFRPNDAVLRVNFFGSRSFRKELNLPIAAIIEDHTHDLIGDWALNSTADWCIASLRKTLPIPEGGILWSPRGLRLPEAPEISVENEEIASARWKAMMLKTRYLAGDDVEKSSFRDCFVNTESFFDSAPVSSLDRQSQEYLLSFDVLDWYQRKQENWNLLKDIMEEGIRVFEPESQGCYPFSLVLRFDYPSERDRVRKALIDNRVYPAILWDVPSEKRDEVLDFSRTMLSVHCDARYSFEDISQLKSIIESIL